MTLRLSDLPPALRKQAETQLDAKPKRVRSQMRGSSPGTCHACREQFTSFAKWEAHSDAERHRRFDIDLGEAS